jgi:hypothetical protein
MEDIYGIVTLNIVHGDPHTGKPFLRLTFPDGVVINITTNIAEMIGGAGAGARLRYEDQQRANAATNN